LLLLCAPDVVLYLNAEPIARAVADNGAQTQCEVERNGLTLAEEIIQAVNANSQPPCEFGLRHCKCGENIIADDFTGMGWGVVIHLEW